MGKKSCLRFIKGQSSIPLKVKEVWLKKDGVIALQNGGLMSSNIIPLYSHRILSPRKSIKNYVLPSAVFSIA